MKIIIIDDELHCINVIVKLLQKHFPNVTIEKTFDNPLEALKYLQNHTIDVVFIDIEMPHLNGFAILEQLSNISFQIVFTTAYNQYAIKAIKYSAFDYLLKPIDKNDLINTMAKLNLQYEKLLVEKSALNTSSEYPILKNKIALSTSEGLIIISIGDIVHCEADSNYTTFYLKNDKPIIASKPIKDAEEILPKNIFLRVHQSHLVNVNEITKYIRGEGGELIMTNNNHIPVSRAKKMDVIAIFNKM